MTTPTKKRCIAISLHGCSTKAAGEAGAAKAAAEHGLKPDVIIGVSGGAALGVPIALGMYEEACHFSRDMRIADWFDIPPVNDDGRITWAAIGRALKSVWGAITGKKGKGAIYSFGVQNTKKTLSKVITEDLFNTYKDGDYAPVYIVSVDWVKTEIRVRNAKMLTYREYLSAVDASAKLPISSTAYWRGVGI
jgi:predicted acylesterase/phospholipase RssA